MIRKLLIVPYFGELPDWVEHWQANVERLRPLGYDFLIDTNEDAFRFRVRDRLGVICPSMRGTGKIWDYRPAFAVLYADEIRGYHFWGHTDFDCVYGRVDRWVTDDFLAGLDMHSNCDDYVNGCWSLYRDTPSVNEAFMLEPDWKEILQDPEPRGWAETSFSQILSSLHDAGDIVKVWTQWQTFREHELVRIRFDGDRLMSGDEEVMMAHFRRTKTYPAGCLS